MMSKEQKNNKLLTSKQLDEKLDEIVIPLISRIPVALKQHEIDTCHELFALAIFEGMKLAENESKKLDAQLAEGLKEARQRDFQDHIMGGGTKPTKIDLEKSASALLSSTEKTPDGKPRFVSPADLDDKGNFKK